MSFKFEPIWAHYLRVEKSYSRYTNISLRDCPQVFSHNLSFFRRGYCDLLWHFADFIRLVIYLQTNAIAGLSGKNCSCFLLKPPSATLFTLLFLLLLLFRSSIVHKIFSLKRSLSFSVTRLSDLLHLGNFSKPVAIIILPKSSYIFMQFFVKVCKNLSFF